MEIQGVKQLDFVTFCRLHGVVIDHLPPIGVWRRYRTEDKTSKHNGAVKFMGDVGWVQNHATMTEPAIWKPEAGDVKIDRQALANQAKRAEEDLRRRQKEAADKAKWILNQCQFARHDYLKAKGFPDEQGNVWKTEDTQLLVIPMRIAGQLVGCQLIDPEGGKKFLFGQRTSGAEFIFDGKGVHVLCEGYATALSVRLALKNMKVPCTLHVCFSAGNMIKVASKLPGGFIVADNDASGTGERTAKQIEWPYWMPPEIGMDANDWHKKTGLFRFAQSMTRSLIESNRKT